MTCGPIITSLLLNMSECTLSTQDIPESTLLLLQTCMSTCKQTHKLDHDEEHRGEPVGTFRKNLKKNIRAPSPIYGLPTPQVFKANWIIWPFGIGPSKKAIFIRVNNPSFNSNISKYQLSHIQNEVLFNTPDLHLRHFCSGQSGLLCKAHYTWPLHSMGPITVSTTSTIGRYGLLQHHQIGALLYGTRCLSSHNQW